MNVLNFPSAVRLILCATFAFVSSVVAQGPSRGYSSTKTFNTSGSTKDEGEPNHCGEKGGASEWYTYTAPARGTLTVTTDGSDYDTVLAVYTGPGFDFSSLVKKGCNNVPGKGGDKVVIPGVTANTIFYIAVDGVNGARGNAKLNMSIGDPLVITSQPVPATINAGKNVTFSATVTGSSPISYQWRHQGRAIPGATQSSYNVFNAQTNHAGNYRLIISNSMNVVTSSIALLTVKAPAPKP